MSTLRVTAGQLSAPDDVRSTIEAALEEMRGAHVVERIWQKDHTVWKPDSTEIINRLGWLDVAQAMQQKIGELEAFAAEIRSARFRHVVLLGMGGSSLCPEVLRATFRSRRGYPHLIVLDSTVPAWVRRVAETIDPVRTLFIVSSKSGGTIEVMSFFKYFWSLAEKRNRGKAGDNFIAITDPGTSLAALAAQNGFRHTFLNPPDIGGRYSALS
ncbi:MAG TPA: glucose-6-phosphate isomerase, partial [Anaerolineae bacterium]